jgi:hypothetical protein
VFLPEHLLIVKAVAGMGAAGDLDHVATCVQVVPRDLSTAE